MSGRSRVRPRAARREAERASRKLGDAREKLFRLEPGGSPERPIEIPTASVVESRARALGCARCGGQTTIEDHAAVVVEAGARRRVRVRCPACRASFDVWLAVVERTLS